MYARDGVGARSIARACIPHLPGPYFSVTSDRISLTGAPMGPRIGPVGAKTPLNDPMGPCSGPISAPAPLKSLYRGIERLERRQESASPGEGFRKRGGRAPGGDYEGREEAEPREEPCPKGRRRVFEGRCGGRKPRKRTELAVEASDDNSAPTRIMKPGACPPRRKLFREESRGGRVGSVTAW